MIRKLQSCLRSFMAFAGAFLVAVGCLTATTAVAESWHTSYIRWIYPQADGSVILTFVTDSSSCPHTGSPKYHLIKVGSNGVTAEGVKNMLSVALLAKGMGQLVSIAFTENGECSINRLLISD